MGMKFAVGRTRAVLTHALYNFSSIKYVSSRPPAIGVCVCRFQRDGMWHYVCDTRVHEMAELAELAEWKRLMQYNTFLYIPSFSPRRRRLRA